MQRHSLETWAHQHLFLAERHRRRERRTSAVVASTAIMMVVEVACGTILGSMALIADGWHMSTHADLHLWQVGPGDRAAVVPIVSDHPQPPSTYKGRLAGLHGLSPVTVEVERCEGNDHRHAA